MPSSSTRCPAATQAISAPSTLSALSLSALLLFAVTAGMAGAATAPRPPLPSSGKPAVLSAANLLERGDSALDAGDVQLADSLFTLAAPIPTSATSAASRHRREILTARLAAARGDWKTSADRLKAWENSPARQTGSGEILFWRGWVALHQARIPEADSLFVLASAYSGEPRAQDALEYRFSALLDNSPALQDYLRGLPESPLPASLRIASLERVPENSRLRPQALWQLALLLEARGESARARDLLTALSRDTGSLPGRRATAVLAFLRESEQPDSALSAYETLLIQSQQGVIAEFSRKRAQGLRRSPQP